jgi:MFS family permease
LLWLGQMVSHVGDSLFFVGIFFLALDVTGSRGGAGLLVAVNFVPALVLGLFAGAIVDRYDRRRVMLAADLLRALAVGAIPLLHGAGRLTPAALGAAIFCLSVGTTLFNPALKSLVPERVPPSHLATVAAIFTVSEFGALVGGPVLAAFIIPTLGHIHLFSLDAVSFLVSAACLALLSRAARALPPRAITLAGLVHEIRTGVEAVAGDRVLRALLLIIAADNLIIMGLAHVATPLLVKDTLGLGPEGYAAAQRYFFLGMVVASMAFWAFGRHMPKGPTILLGIVLDGLTFIPIAFAQSLPQLQAALFVHALAIPMIVIPRTVLVQQLVPGHLHGRAFSLLNVTVFGMMALSCALTGALAEVISPRTLFIVLGLLGAIPGVIGLGIPTLRGSR